MVKKLNVTVSKLDVFHLVEKINKVMGKKLSRNKEAVCTIFKQPFNHKTTLVPRTSNKNDEIDDSTVAKSCERCDVHTSIHSVQLRELNKDLSKCKTNIKRLNAHNRMLRGHYNVSRVNQREKRLNHKINVSKMIIVFIVQGSVT